MPCMDPEGFEQPGTAPEFESLSWGLRQCKVSAYVQDITEGKGSSSGLLGAPLYPKGIPIPMPRDSAALSMSLSPDADPESDVTPEPLPFEFAMAAAVHTLSDDPQSVDGSEAY